MRTLSIMTAALLFLAASSRADPAADLAGQWKSLKDVRTLHAHFICEKKLQTLDTPLVSQGELWIKKDSKDVPGGVRFTTNSPYLSELILTEGKVFARSQHETEWTKSNQS